MVMYFMFFLHMFINVYIHICWGLKGCMIQMFLSFSWYDFCCFLKLSIGWRWPVGSGCSPSLFGKGWCVSLCFRSECDQYFMFQCGRFHMIKIEMETLNCFNQSLAATEKKKGETLRWEGKKQQRSEVCLACLLPRGSLFLLSSPPNLCHEGGHRPGSSPPQLGWESFNTVLRLT